MKRCEKRRQARKGTYRRSSLWLNKNHPLFYFYFSHMENHQNQNKNPNQDLQGWGTWEELLLASAVDRHGFKDWDTIAMEVQSRTNRTSLLATAHHCEQKFHDLNRRFKDDVPPPQQNGDVSAATAEDSDHVPWLDKLRKQRVAELRRDVQRSDVSILYIYLSLSLNIYCFLSLEISNVLF